MANWVTFKPTSCELSSRHNSAPYGRDDDDDTDADGGGDAGDDDDEVAMRARRPRDPVRRRKGGTDAGS